MCVIYQDRCTNPDCDEEDKVAVVGHLLCPEFLNTKTCNIQYRRDLRAGDMRPCRKCNGKPLDPFDVPAGMDPGDRPREPPPSTNTQSQRVHRELRENGTPPSGLPQGMYMASIPKEVLANFVDPPSGLDGSRRQPPSVPAATSQGRAYQGQATAGAQEPRNLDSQGSGGSQYVGALSTRPQAVSVGQLTIRPEFRNNPNAARVIRPDFYSRLQSDEAAAARYQIARQVAFAWPGPLSFERRDQHRVRMGALGRNDLANIDREYRNWWSDPSNENFLPRNLEYYAQEDGAQGAGQAVTSGGALIAHHGLPMPPGVSTRLDTIDDWSPEQPRGGDDSSVTES